MMSLAFFLSTFPLLLLPSVPGLLQIASSTSTAVAAAPYQENHHHGVVTPSFIITATASSGEDANSTVAATAVMEPSSTLHDDENDRQPPIGRLLLPSNQQLRRAKWFKTSRPTLPNHWEKKQQPPVLPPLSPSSTAVVATSYAAAGIDRWRQPQQHSSSLVKKSEVKAEKEGIRMLLLVADDSRPPPQGLRRISMARGELTATSAKQYKTKKPLKLPLLELAVTWQGGAMIVNNLSIGSPEQRFDFMVDFFGGDSWLLDASVDIPPGVDPRGGVKARYLPAASSTFTNETKSQGAAAIFDDAAYGEGWRIADVIWQPATVRDSNSSSSPIFPLQFGLIRRLKVAGLFFFPEVPADGLLGLAPLVRNQSANNCSSFLVAAADAHLLPRRIVTIWITGHPPAFLISRNNNTVMLPVGGITLGGVNSRRCEPLSTWSFVPAVARPTIRPWSFRIKSLYIGGGGGEGWMMAVDQVAVLAELGVRSTQGPVQQVGKLARALGATIEPWSQPGKVEFYTVDCTAAVNISLSVIVQDVRGRDVVLLQLTRDDLIYTAYEGHCRILFVGFGDIKVWYLGTHVVRGHCVGVDFSRPTDPLFGVGKSGAAAKTLMSSAESKERGLQNKLRRDFISSMET